MIIAVKTDRPQSHQVTKLHQAFVFPSWLRGFVAGFLAVSFQHRYNQRRFGISRMGRASSGFNSRYFLPAIALYSN